jgi:hypothetical protein
MSTGRQEQPPRCLLVAGPWWRFVVSGRRGLLYLLHLHIIPIIAAGRGHLGDGDRHCRQESMRHDRGSQSLSVACAGWSRDFPSNSGTLCQEVEPRIASGTRRARVEAHSLTLMCFHAGTCWSRWTQVVATSSSNGQPTNETRCSRNTRRGKLRQERRERGTQDTTAEDEVRRPS